MLSAKEALDCDAWIPILVALLDHEHDTSTMVTWDLLLVTAKLLASCLQSGHCKLEVGGIEGCCLQIDKVMNFCNFDTEREERLPSQLKSFHVSVLATLVKVFNELVRLDPELYSSDGALVEKTISWIISLTEYAKTFGFEFAIDRNDFLNLSTKFYDSLGFMTESVENFDEPLLEFIWRYDSCYDLLMSISPSLAGGHEAAVLQSVTKITRVIAHLLQSETLRSGIHANVREQDEVNGTIIKDSIQFLAVCK